MTKSQLTRDELFQIVLEAGDILIRNGAETVRTEDAIMRMCHSRGFSEVSSFITPSIIQIGSDRANGTCYIRNIKRRGSDLYKISLVNDFSRRFVHTPMSYQEAMEQLQNIEHSQGYPMYLMALAAAIGGSTFSLLIGGTVRDILPCFITSLATMILMFKIDKISLPVLSHLFSGILIAILANFFGYIHFGNNIHMIIIGAMLPLLPGVPFTNGVRDFMYGDLISGTSRVIESIVIIVALSFGVALVTNLIAILGGK